MVTGAVLLAPSPLVMTDLLDRTDTAAPPALDKETDRAPVGRLASPDALRGLAVLHLRPRTQLAVCAAILVGYWLTLTRVPVPVHGAGVLTPHGNLPGYIDRRVLGRSHLYADGPYDPEGLLSTLPATVTVVIGYWAGRFLRRAPVSSATSRRLAWSGVGFVVAGELP